MNNIFKNYKEIEENPELYRISIFGIVRRLRE